MNIKTKKGRSGFSLIEIIVVVGIIAVLAIVVLYTLNPRQVLNEGQDGNRIAGIQSLDKAISIYYSDAITNPNTLYMGSSSIIYVSIPDPTATTTAGTDCTALGFPSGQYHCAASSTYEYTNGTGWIPINFTSYSGGNIISSLPVDPLNTSSSGEYYVYVTNGTSYEIMANPTSPKGSTAPQDFVKGSNTTLASSFPVICITDLAGAGTASAGVNPARVDLTWDFSNSSVTGYNVFVSNSTGGPYTIIGSSTTNIYSDRSGLTNGNTYYFVVQPYSNSNSDICQSNQATILVPAGTRGH